MMTHRELGKLPAADPCLRCGLSIFREKSDAFHQQRLFPRLGGYLARAVLSPDHGQVKLTPGKLPSHTTLWTYEGVDRLSILAEVEQVS